LNYTCASYNSFRGISKHARISHELGYIKQLIIVPTSGLIVPTFCIATTEASLVSMERLPSSSSSSSYKLVMSVPHPGTSATNCSLRDPSTGMV